MRTKTSVMPQLEVLKRCAPAQPIVFTAIARALRPRPHVTPSQWAATKRVISPESGSRYHGEWKNERAPHLVDVMDALGPNDPCEDVTFVASAQVGKTEVALNFFGWIVNVDPGPTIIVMPSIDLASTFVKTKLQPTIDATPSLRKKVLEYTDRSDGGSTQSFKRFPGGFGRLTHAGSSKGLQMVSARYTIGDELSEWPAEAGDRGDPAEQLEMRTEIFERDRKRLWTSTPKLLGSCRITARYHASDQRRRYVPCPHCGAYQVLRFDQLKYDSEAWPHRAWFECTANKCRMDHADKAAMMAAGEWIATAGDDGPGDWFEATDLEKWKSRKISPRKRGFHIWKAYNLMVSWDEIVADWLKRKDQPEQLRVFVQQVLGEAYEEKGDAPDAELLHKSRIMGLSSNLVPAGPLALTGAVDVQGNRLEWAIWGWSEGLTRWLVAKGIVEGEPFDAATWHALDREVVLKTWHFPSGFSSEVELWCIDAGYASHQVYAFTRGRPRILAIDGRAGRTHPIVGTSKPVDINLNGKRIRKGAMLWPVGTYPLKADHYGSIRKAIAGPDEYGAMMPGSMILPGDIDLAYAEQLTAEYLDRVERRTGQIDYVWAKLQGRPNEALDIACYARAGAFHLGLDRLTPEQWAALRAERGGPPKADTDQGDLFAVSVQQAPGMPAPEQPAPRRRGVRGRAQN